MLKFVSSKVTEQATEEVTLFCKRFTVISVFILLAFSFSSARAANSADLFKAEVAVDDQSTKQRQLAAASGLMDVLLRLSGSEEVRSNELLQKKSRSALNYVEQFRYENSVDTDGNKQLQLALDFSPSSLKSLLAEAQFSFWPVKRPAVLVWLVEDSAEHGRQIVPADDLELELAQALQAAASYRGLPLAFPLLDFQDQTALNAEQLWRLDEQAVLDASARYGNQLILVGKLSLTSDAQVLSSWQFYSPENIDSYDFRNASLRQTMDKAIAPAVQYQLNHYALSLDSESSLRMQVSAVNTYSDYRALLSLLNKLDAVTSVQVVTLQADTLQLSLQSEADKQQLAALLALEPSLKDASLLDDSAGEAGASDSSGASASDSGAWPGADAPIYPGPGLQLPAANNPSSLSYIWQP
ncbi:DUF2066 domain-containing protein [Agaribacterium haliotis]|uniref:DUF2066 domain-containing protein n=1 Tax=Agaribacterium haliotis TaxID=2013869 RepID=UPI0013040AEC|nr:DUF2066 domain-containing protein [Agaribacterium haliotis]